MSTAEAEAVARSTPKNSRGLPLWESRPGARVALFLDFDGGVYGGDERYSPASIDRDSGTFNEQEQIAIIRAAMEVAESYAGFDVNVTTNDSARTRSSKWAWILITNDEGTSGFARVGVIGRPSSALAVAGSEAVFNPPTSQRGYLLTHELGHNFGLNHSGLWKDGRFQEWSELKTSRTSDWMGGRSSHFREYRWTISQTEYSQSWQDPAKIIGDEAGLVGDGGGGGVPSSLATRWDEGESESWNIARDESATMAGNGSSQRLVSEPMNTSDAESMRLRFILSHTGLDSGEYTEVYVGDLGEWTQLARFYGGSAGYSQGRWSKEVEIPRRYANREMRIRFKSKASKASEVVVVSDVRLELTR